MRKSLRQSLLLVLAVAVVGVLLYRSPRSMGFDWSLLWASLKQARPLPLLLSVVAIYLAYAVRALRWARFARYQRRLGFSGLFSATLIGFSAIFLLGRAGEPIRPLLIARKEGLPVSSGFGTYVLERVFDVAATVVIAGLALLMLSQATLGGESWALLMTARTTGITLLAGLLIVIAFLLYFRFHGARAIERRLADWHHRPGWHARAAGLFQGFSEGLRAIRTFGDLLVAVWYTAVHWAAIAAIYYLVQQSFPGRLEELSFPAALLVLAFTMVGSIVQLPVVGGGSQLASLVAFTQVFGVEKEPATAASVVLWLVTFAACIVAGVPLLIREGWSMGELRRLAREEKEAETLGTHVSLEKAPSGSGEVRP